MNLFRKLNKHFSFTKGEQIAVAILCCIIVLLIVGEQLIYKRNEERTSNRIEIEHAISLLDSIHNANKGFLFEFNPNTIDSLGFAKFDLPSNIKNNIIRYRKNGGSFKKKEELKKIYGMNDSIYQEIHRYILIPKQKEKLTKQTTAKKKTKTFLFKFNPNKLPPDSFLLLNLPANIKQNIIKYREAGGFFNKRSDLRKIYGMNDSIFLTLTPYIDITEEDDKNTQNKEEQKLAPKYIDLNKATAEELMQFKGVGEVLSTRIIKFRNSLGGFHSTSQIREVYGLPNQIANQIILHSHVSTDSISKIDINFANKKELSQHPYINYDLATKIIELRSKIGVISHIHLQKDSTISEIDYNKIAPYINN